ncbi:MAG: CdaR family protein [Eubacteriales bacterium]|nr:CdaR family protein [Eubacteriales bacterium]
MKIKSLLTNNIGLKIVSVIAAILIWLLVVNIDNPSISRTFIISSVEILNEAYIEDTGKVCLKNEDAPSIRVTISGTAKSLKGLREDNIKLTADLRQAVNLDTDPVMIPIVASLQGTQGILSSAVSVSPQNLEVTLEEKVSNEFMVSISNTSKVGKGYEIGTQTVNPDKIRITGPKSLLGKIDTVNVYPYLEKKTSDYTADEDVVVIDKNGDTLSEYAMSNLKIENEGKVTVTTELWPTRSDITLRAQTSGSPATGYIAESVSTVPETVTVAGTEEALKMLSEQDNSIELEAVDISGKDSDVEEKVSLAEILPEDLKLANGISDEVLVRINILPDGGKTFSLPTSAIVTILEDEDLKNWKSRVSNVSKNKNDTKDMSEDKKQVSFALDKIEFRVKAVEAEDGTIPDIDDFRVEDVRAYIDLREQEDGTGIVVPVTLELPDGYELIDEVTTEVTIAPIATVEEEE